MENQFFICRCNSLEHLAVFTADDEFVYLEIRLIPERNIFKRIRSAALYIFGHKSNYGEFDEFIFNPDDKEKLLKIAESL